MLSMTETQKMKAEEEDFPRFPYRLLRMAQDPRIASVKWNNSGHLILINTERLQDDIRCYWPEYYHALCQDTFISQLYSHGFTNLTSKIPSQYHRSSTPEMNDNHKPSNIWTFKHPLFLEDRPDLVPLVRKIVQEGQSSELFVSKLKRAVHPIAKTASQSPIKHTATIQTEKTNFVELAKKFPPGTNIIFPPGVDALPYHHENSRANPIDLTATEDEPKVKQAIELKSMQVHASAKSSGSQPKKFVSIVPRPESESQKNTQHDKSILQQNISSFSSKTSVKNTTASLKQQTELQPTTSTSLQYASAQKQGTTQQTPILNKNMQMYSTQSYSLVTLPRSTENNDVAAFQQSLSRGLLQKIPTNKQVLQNNNVSTESEQLQKQPEAVTTPPVTAQTSNIERSNAKGEQNTAPTSIPVNGNLQPTETIDKFNNNELQLKPYLAKPADMQNNFIEASQSVVTKAVDRPFQLYPDAAGQLCNPLHSSPFYKDRDVVVVPFYRTGKGLVPVDPEIRKQAHQSMLKITELLERTFKRKPVDNSASINNKRNIHTQTTTEADDPLESEERTPKILKCDANTQVCLEKPKTPKKTFISGSISEDLNSKTKIVDGDKKNKMSQTEENQEGGAVFNKPTVYIDIDYSNVGLEPIGYSFPNRGCGTYLDRIISKGGCGEPMEIMETAHGIKCMAMDEELDVTTDEELDESLNHKKPHKQIYIENCQSKSSSGYLSSERCSSDISEPRNLVIKLPAKLPACFKPVVLVRKLKL